MRYAVVTVLAALGCVYLLFRRGNAFAADVTPPLRLRRWAAAFLAVIALGHVWYLPGTMMADGDAAALWMLIGALLDCLLTIPVALVVMLCMLQDRRRPLWPVWAAVAPLVIMMGVNIANRSDALLPWLQSYFLLAVIGFTVYMVREVQRYGRWLRDSIWCARCSATGAGCATTMPTWSTRRCGRACWYWPSSCCCSAIT